MQGPKTKNTKNSTIVRLFLAGSCTQKEALSSGASLFLTKKDSREGCRLMYAWWSCRVPPPGPKGNLISVYKLSLIRLFRTAFALNKAQMAKTVPLKAVRTSCSCPRWNVSDANITPFPLRSLGKIDGYQLIRQLAQRQIAEVRTR